MVILALKRITRKVLGEKMSFPRLISICELQPDQIQNLLPKSHMNIV